MAKADLKIPTQDELKRLPRWGHVALLARAVRRVQPLYLHAWPKAPRKFPAAIEASIAEGELAAAQGKRTPNLNAAGEGAMQVYGETPDEIRFAYDYIDGVSFAASRVAFASLQSDATFAHEGLETAVSVVSRFERAGRRKGLVKQFVKLVWEDYKRLETTAANCKWKNTTTVNATLFGPLWPTGPPAGWSATTARKARPKAIDPQELRLPRDLIAFLKTGKRLKYNASKTEVGPIVLKPLEHLKLSQFEASTDGTPAHEKDPNRGKRGHYIVRAVDLVAECDAYGPEGILAWLPDDRCFGQWDPDHQQVIVFHKTTWSQIVAKPTRYLDAQWGDFEGFGRYIEPWKHGSFKRAKR